MRAILLMLLLAIPGQAQQWDKYIPEKQRKDIFKKSVRTASVGASIGSGHLVLAVWLTDPMARVIVSNFIDRERLTNEEAGERFQALRVKDKYTFLIAAKYISVPIPFGRSRSAKSASDPLYANELFLQRSNDRKNFSKGQVQERNFDVELYGFESDTMYTAEFPQKNRSSESIIRDMPDKIELQFTMNNKRIILEYKLKDMVSNLSEL
jgi:hypothetical protein